MASYQYGPFRAAPTISDLSANTGYAVVLNASSQMVLAGANVWMDGVLVDDPKSGTNGTYQVRDVAKVVAGAAVAVNALLATNASGQFITATSGQIVVAKALEAASGALSVIRAEILAGARSLAP